MYTPCQIAEPLASKGEGNAGSNNGGIEYKRYRLSSEKTFKSFFHPNKAELLHLVDHFLQRTGKFAIAGYPHKLGLLLHGPPGTGKTSLIKVGLVTACNSLPSSTLYSGLMWLKIPPVKYDLS